MKAKKVIVELENGQVIEYPGRYAYKLHEKPRKAVSVFVGDEGFETFQKLAQKYTGGVLSHLLKPLAEWYLKHAKELLEDKIKFNPNQIPEILDKYTSYQKKLEIIQREKELLENQVENLRNRIQELEAELTRLESINDSLKAKIKSLEEKLKFFEEVKEEIFEFVDPILGIIRIKVKAHTHLLDKIADKLRRMNYGKIIGVLDVLRDLGLIEYRVVRS